MVAAWVIVGLILPAEGVTVAEGLAIVTVGIEVAVTSTVEAGVGWTREA